MGLPFLARVRDRRTRSDRRATVGALGECGGARGAGEVVVARAEEDGTRRVGLHADRAQEAVLERLLLALDPPEVNGGRVRRGLRLFFFGSGSNVLRLLRAGWTRHDSEDLRKALDRQYANDGEKLKTHRGHRRV